MNATTQWDAVCADFHFPTTANATADGSFETEYFGQHFQDDFEQILQVVAEACATPIPHYNADDTLTIKVENWPDP